MDETPLNFDELGEKNVDVKEVKTVLVKGADHEKTRFQLRLHVWLTEQN